MNHLVISVSHDSSLELLGRYADITLLDEAKPLPVTESYYSLYIRSHFSRPDTQPHNFRMKIELIVEQAREKNPNIEIIDGMDTVDAIVAFEDKWLQYQTYQSFMPRTQLLEATSDAYDFTKPVFKKRLSSRGRGVTWDQAEVTGSPADWIIQESLTIAEEMRIFVVRGQVYPVGAIRQSKTATQGTKALDARQLKQEELSFASTIAAQVPGLDMIGLDIVRAPDDGLKLLEVNRSPGFAAFEKLTGVNLADLLYSKYD